MEFCLVAECSDNVITGLVQWESHSWVPTSIRDILIWSSYKLRNMQEQRLIWHINLQ